MLDIIAPGSIGYLIIKSLHIAAVMFWMAGMLYLPRLFVYHHGAEQDGELEAALLKQEHNLLKIIMNPALILMWGLACLMIIANPALFSSGWFHLKLSLVLALSSLHGFYAGQVKQFASGKRSFTEKFWRIINEVPAITAIIIIVLAIVKPF